MLTNVLGLSLICKKDYKVSTPLPKSVDFILVGDETLTQLPENTKSGITDVYPILNQKGFVVDLSRCVNLQKIPERFFAGCENLFYADLSGCDKLREIPREAFSGCTNLSNIRLPKNIERICDSSFNSTALQFIDLRNTKVNAIEYGAFKYNERLWNIMFSDSLREIGCHVFEGCTALQSVRLPGSISSVSKKAFTRSGISTVYAPRNFQGEADGVIVSKNDDTDISQYAKCGQYYFSKKDYKKAKAYFSQALQYNQTDAETYCNLGITESKCGILKSAIRNLTNAINIAPENKNYYLTRGKMYSDADMYKEAKHDFKQAIKLDENFVQAYVSLGEIYLNDENYLTAMSTFKKAIKIDSQCKEAYLNLGLCYFNKGNYKAALKNYTKALEIDNDYVSAYVHRSGSYYQQGMGNEAIADLDKAIELNPNHEYAYLRRGFICSMTKKYDKAILSYNAAIKLNPDCKDAYLKRGTLYNELGCFDFAGADFQAADKLSDSQTRFSADLVSEKITVDELQENQTTFCKKKHVTPKTSNKVAARLK